MSIVALNSQMLYSFELWSTIYTCIMHFFVVIFQSIFPDINSIDKCHIKTLHEISTEYIETNKTRFLQTYASKHFNSNIDILFYSIKSFQAELLAKVPHPFEVEWKTRILFENSPRGNVIMHYDVYKQAFAYYSDNQSIPYSLLNAIAMKYVIVYRCRDFFMDNEITPETSHSPLIQLQKTEEKREKDEKKQDNPKKSISFANDAPFAKLRSYTKKQASTTNDTGTDTLDKPEYVRNKFVCLGKMVNFSFLQKKSINKNKLIPEISQYVKDLEGEHQLQNRILKKNDTDIPNNSIFHNSSRPFSYSDYKRMKQESLLATL